MSQEERPSVFKDSEVDNAMEKIDLSRIASGVKRRLWLPVVFGIVLAFGFGILSQHLLKKYNAQVLLLYKAQNRQLNVPGMKGGFNVGFFSMPTMVDMLSLPTHYDAVKSILGLQQTPEQIGEMVSVSIPNKQADLIQISCTADSPGLAVDIVNTLATVGVKHSQTVRGNQLQIARDYFADQARLAQDKLSRKMVEIAQFKKEHNFVSLHTDGTGSLAGMEEAEKQLRDGKMEYESLLIEYENLRREVGKIPDHIVREAYQDDPIRSRIGQTELALLRARTRYAEDNPKVKVLEEELTQLRRMVSESSFEDANDRVYVKNEMKDHLNIELVRLQGRLRAAQKRKEEAELVLNQMNQDFANLPEEQIEFSRLVHSKSMLEEELSMSEEAIRSVDILISLGRGDVELYQTAERAERNKSMFLTFLPVVGLGLGLTLGLVAALMLELADGRLCTGKELTQRYSPPCIQVIPELSRLNPATAEQKTLFFIRNISDRLTYLRGKESLRSILVTSGINGEG
ncbi:MAG: hypothetical protein KDK78_12270, partial [Chlamydiia bacterium]|nr:hypothetical protein [Chlamydiia bacterium]